MWVSVFWVLGRLPEFELSLCCFTNCRWAACLISLICSALCNRHHGNLVLVQRGSRGHQTRFLGVGTRYSLQVSQ